MKETSVFWKIVTSKNVYVIEINKPFCKYYENQIFIPRGYNFFIAVNIQLIQLYYNSQVFTDNWKKSQISIKCKLQSSQTLSRKKNVSFIETNKTFFKYCLNWIFIPRG